MKEAPCANCGHEDVHRPGGPPYLYAYGVWAYRLRCLFPGCDCRDFEEAA